MGPKSCTNKSQSKFSIHKTHHIPNMRIMHHFFPHNLFYDWWLGLHQSDKKIQDSQKRILNIFYFVKLWIFQLSKFITLTYNWRAFKEKILILENTFPMPH